MPLGLYVHLPWCASKCPYCDFNSHALKGVLPVDQYLTALDNDLASQATWAQERAVTSIFIGGGTPSLFPGDAIARLMDSVRSHLVLADDAEVTMEANPGSVESDKLASYFSAGVNRLSIGVQSFDDGALKRLGRLHDAATARASVIEAKLAGFARINIDLMVGLPQQTLAEAMLDVTTALELDPGHISHYQLTMEPNTVFAANPPALPSDEEIDAMTDACHAALRDVGYENYEISAHARAGHACEHNLNYWRYGDYLAAGAGAHAKLTDIHGPVYRYQQPANPRAYMERYAGTALPKRSRISDADKVFEYFLNRLRLREPFPPLAAQDLAPAVYEQMQSAIERGKSSGLLASSSDDTLQPTDQGFRFLNDLQALFLP